MGGGLAGDPMMHRFRQRIARRYWCASETHLTRAEDIQHDFTDPAWPRIPRGHRQRRPGLGLGQHLQRKTRTR